MVDPGTAVGVISLGLQVLQGLATFYKHYASFNIELSAVVRRIESLYMIIDALEGPVRDLERDDHISAAVRQCIEACKAGIQELEVYQKKCGSMTVDPAVKKKKSRASKSRLLFPFRKATLDDLTKALDRLQSNLDTVALALQLDTALSCDEMAKKRSAHFDHSLNLVHHRQVYGIELLETLVMNSRLQNHQNGRSNTHVTTFPEKVNEQLLSFSNEQSKVAERLDSLTKTIMLLQDGVASSSLRSSDACSSNLGLSAPNRDTSREPDMLDQYLEPSIVPTCTCPVLPCSNKHKRIHPGWIASTFWQSTSNHSRSCPFYPVSQKSFTIGINFAVRARGFDVLIDTRLTWGTPMSFQVTHWNVVTQHSPAFELMSSLFYYLLLGGKDEGKAIQLVQGNIMRLIEQKRACPFDVLQDGQTLFHYACEVIRPLFKNVKLLERELQPWLLFWVNIGVPANEIGGYWKRTPLEDVVRKDYGDCDSTHRSTSIVLRELVRLGGSWSARRIISNLHLDRAPVITVLIRELIARDDHLSDELGTYPLLQSVVGKSITALKTSFHEIEFHRQDNENCSLIQAQLNMLVKWPEGLDIFISNWKDNPIIKRYGTRVLETAIRSEEKNAAVLLLRAGCSINYSTWDLVATFGETRRAQIELVIERIVQQVENTLPTEHKTSDLVGSSDYLIEEAMLYRPFGLQVCNAERLFNAGFQDVDQPTKSGTNLWHHATQDFGWNDGHRVEKLELVQWLIDKGARLDALHPCYKTTPAQLLAERMAIRIVLRENIVPHEFELGRHNSVDSIQQQSKFQNLYGKVFTSDGTDDCICACTSSGCSVVGSVLRTLTQVFDCAKVSLDYMLHAILDWLSIDIDSRPRMVQPIIRSITFEKLKLTHTCHDHGHFIGSVSFRFWGYDCRPKQPLFEHDILDIHVIDQADIRLLEELMVEFEIKMRYYSGSTWSFIDGYWTDRMHQIDEEKIKSHAYHAEKNRDLGVHFHEPCDSESEPQARSVTEKGTWEWFEEKIADVMRVE